jgi:copper chaperone CopZ
VQTEHLKVKGMTCGGCVKNVTHALRSTAGVAGVKVSLADGEAIVEYDERVTSPARLESAVKEAGYEVNVMEAS